jgi:hypothetical protein
VVSLNKPAPQTVTFRYSTSNGTASSSTDYSAVSNASGSIPAGASSTTLNVNTTENTTPESNETFNLTLSQVVNAVVTDGTAVATIIDDDNPTLSVSDVTVSEGGTASFTVSLSKPAPSTVTFSYATADGTATSPGDYTGLALTSGSIAAGQQTRTITVTTKTDSLVESAETFFLNISNLTNATPADPQGKATITDTTPQLTLSGPTGDVAEGSPAILRVSMPQASTQPVSVDWTTSNGSAESTDYTPHSGTVTIPVGQKFVDFVVNIVTDTEAEGRESFDVILSNPQNASIASPSAGRVTVNIAASTAP